MRMCQLKRLCNVEPLAQPVQAEHANSSSKDLGPTMIERYFFRDISISSGILLGGINRNFWEQRFIRTDTRLYKCCLLWVYRWDLVSWAGQQTGAIKWKAGRGCREEWAEARKADLWQAWVGGQGGLEEAQFADELGLGEEQAVMDWTVSPKFIHWRPAPNVVVAENEAFGK